MSSKKCKSSEKTSKQLWSEAIKDLEARIQITETKEEIWKLEAAIRVCKRRLENCEKWPGNSD